MAIVLATSTHHEEASVSVLFLEEEEDVSVIFFRDHSILPKFSGIEIVPHGRTLPLPQRKMEPPYILGTSLRQSRWCAREVRKRGAQKQKESSP